MAGSVFANNRSIVHKKDGGTHLGVPPDVCKTPSPGGPVPVPYPNLARSADLAAGSKKTTISNAPIALESSNLSKSSGDEPGTVGGIISNVNRGKLKFALYSFDVKVEGKGVVRFGDPGLGNHNSANTAYPLLNGAPNVIAYGDEAEEENCERCGELRATHRIYVYDTAVDAVCMFYDAIEAVLRPPIQRRQQFLNPLVTAMEAATVTEPGSADAVNILSLGRKRFGRLRSGSQKFNSHEVRALQGILDAFNAIYQTVAPLRDEITMYTARFISTSRMYGVALCKCLEEKDKPPHAFAAVSGDGSNTTTILGPADIAGLLADMASLRAACVAQRLSNQTYGWQWLVTGNDAPTDALVREEWTDLFTFVDDFTTAVENAVTLTSAATTNITQSQQAGDWNAFTLLGAAVTAVQDLTAQQDNPYTWMTSDAPQLAPPAQVRVLNPDGGGISAPTDYTRAANGDVDWPTGNYQHDREEDDSNAPFACAAPKVISLAHDNGHVPLTLCEMYGEGALGARTYVNATAWTYTGPEDQAQAAAQDNTMPGYTRQTERYQHRDVVPHCDTCQEVVSRMVCYREGNTCQ